MILELKMPKQGQSVETCILTQWHLNAGDRFSAGDLLFSYETDKAAFDEEASSEGILLERFFDGGDDVPVLELVGYAGTRGETLEEFKAGKYNLPSKQTSNISRQAQQLIIGSDTNVEHIENRAFSVPKYIESQSVLSEHDKLFISPRARKLANKKRVIFKNLLGSGPRGRIIEKDILTEIGKGKCLTPLAMKKAELDHLLPPEVGSSAYGKITSKELVKPTYNHQERRFEKYSDHKLGNVRKIIATVMYKSLQNSAQLTHHISACAQNMLKVRKEVKSRLENGYQHNITINDMVCFAVVRALKAHPELNAHLLDDQLRVFQKVNLGIAVDTERGLIVPILIDADDLSLAGLSFRLKELAEKSKSGQISPDVLQPTTASFTVSNLGTYGIEFFTPIINLPQVAILGINTILKRPAELEDGTLGFLPFMGLSLTYDHRAIDGGPASSFLREVKKEIEALSVNLL
jgi:pyruvate dehydrogenase E2 component (dihydrolipoamide acetyltransferase)